MNVDAVLEAVEQVLLSRQLSPVERFVLCQSWIGKTYSEMAQDSAYGSPHLKEVGSQLWDNLSKAVGQRVTKKNLHLILSQYQQNSTGKARNTQQQAFPIDILKDDNLAGSVAQAVQEFPGGPLPLNSPLYINRPPIEKFAFAELNKPGGVIRIKAPEKMGKSSLLNRIVARARAFGYKTAELDFQEADAAVFASFDKFLRWFCANISRQLHLNPRLDDYWDEEMGSKVSCKIYFEAYLLEQINTPIVLALNDVNQIFEHPNIVQDFLPMLRFWQEQARVAEAWQKLRLLIVHSTEIYAPLKLNQSPFNVGVLIRLPELTSVQVEELARRYGLDWTESNSTEQLMAMVGGHPYLVSVAFYHLCRREITLAELLQAAPTATGIYSHHLRSLLALLRDEAELARALQQVVSAYQSVPLEAIAAYKLESMGLVQLEGNRAKPSCELYRLYFRQQLRENNWIDVSFMQLDTTKQDYQYSLSNNIDELTQLANRRYFSHYLETQWEQWTSEISPLSLILCDIDCFKFYNEAHGHQSGDACLRRIASAIVDCVQQQATMVARYGGEEFAILLPQTDDTTAVEVAETIRGSIKELAIAHDHSSVDGFPDEVLTLSLGVATTTPNPETSPEMLITAAGEALSGAKRQGRNCVSVCRL